MSLALNRRFSPLFWTQFLGALNDNVFKNALVILITYREIKVFGLQGGLLVALASGLFILPFFLFSAQAGVLNDRFSKARIMRWVKLAEIVFMSLAAFCLWHGFFGALLGILFLMGMHSTYFGPAKYSIIPDLVPADQVLKANAWVETGTFISILLGLILGNILASQGVDGKYLNVAIVGVAVLGYLISRLIPETPVHAEAEAADRTARPDFGVFRSTGAVWRQVKSMPNLWAAIHGISWFWFVGAAVITLLPVFGKYNLKVDELTTTTFIMAFTVGIGIGAAVMGKIGADRARLEFFSRFGLYGMGLILIGIGALAGLQTRAAADFTLLRSVSEYFGADWKGPVFALALTALAAMGAFFTVPLYSSLQTAADPGMRSRVIGANNIVNALYMVISAVFLMVLQGVGLDSSVIFIFLGIANSLFVQYQRRKAKVTA